MTPNDDQDGKCSGRCGCTGGVGRRDFLKIAGVGSMAILGSGMPVMAGPFEALDFEKLVPADKKLHPEWVKSLFKRDTPQVYKGKDLQYIGMPVGGICCGQLYLGGDGKLWQWDIFNQHRQTGDGGYRHPAKQQAPIDQGLSLRLKWNEKVELRPLDAQRLFRGEFPRRVPDRHGPLRRSVPSGFRRP